MKRGTRLLLLYTSGLLLALSAPLHSGPLLKEDWIYTYEPTHPTYWGVQWGEHSFFLPYRALQRGKHELESRYFKNWRFGSERGGAGGTALRAFSTAMDFGMFMGLQNVHHALGHDAAARELSRSYGLGVVPDRYSQVLPRLLGGGELSQNERNTFGGPDANAQYMVQPMQEEVHLSFEAAKDILAQGRVNNTQVSNYIFMRLRFLMDGPTEIGTLDQDFADFTLGRSTMNAQMSGRFQGKSKYSTDFTNYVHYINAGRYGVQNVTDYKLTMSDIKMTFYYQLLDPVFWLAFWKLGNENIYHGREQTSIPMLRLSDDISYLPSFRTYFSPFGIEYYLDNFFHFEGMLFNLYGTRGDNKYEDRLGFGFSVENIALRRGITVGLFGDYSRQPWLSRILDRTPIPASEVGRLRTVYNFGGSIKAPLYFWGSQEDRSSAFIYTRAGQKNDGWVPGEYLKGSTYVQLGIGLHL